LLIPYFKRLSDISKYYNAVKKIPEFLGMVKHVEEPTIVNLQKMLYKRELREREYGSQV
jgi:hypothetical protein